MTQLLPRCRQRPAPAVPLAPVLLPQALGLPNPCPRQRGFSVSLLAFHQQLRQSRDLTNRVGVPTANAHSPEEGRQGGEPVTRWGIPFPTVWEGAWVLGGQKELKTFVASPALSQYSTQVADAPSYSILPSAWLSRALVLNPTL